MDWPAAVARDFLLAGANTVPLYTPPGSTAASEKKTVEEDIHVLARLANQIQLNDGINDNHFVIEEHLIRVVYFHRCL